ncbi:glycine cleavage system protein GcvH [Streptomyces albidoflavus]
MSVPAELRYTEEHEWVGVLDGGKGRVGLTHHAQTQLGDIVFVQLPAVGQALDSGQSMGHVESVKSVTDIYAPVTGKVVAVNAELDHSPELVNEDPYGDGWLVEIEPTDAAEEWRVLLDAEKYQGLIAEG